MYRKSMGLLLSILMLFLLYIPVYSEPVYSAGTFSSVYDTYEEEAKDIVDSLSEEERNIFYVVMCIYFFLIFLFFVPIVIYRCFIERKPLPKKRAVKITLIYSAAGAAVSVLLQLAWLGVGIAAFWSIVDYFILTKGKESAKTLAVPGVKTVILEEKKYKACRSCGALLSDNENFCRNCGTEVSENDGEEEAEKGKEKVGVICGCCGVLVPPDSVFCSRCGKKL